MTFLQHVFVGLIPATSDSDVVYLKFLGAEHIILNSNEAITELLDKRSAIYSDRVRYFSNLPRPGP
jgi:hypothetical protein